MSSSAAPALGPFRGLKPYDENSAALFYGRDTEKAALHELITREGAQVCALCGEPGVGKTSLIRAGLFPQLAQHDVVAVYLGNYASFDQELWQALGKVRAVPPTPGESAPAYLVSVARGSRKGTLLVLDHLEELLGGDADTEANLAALGAFLKVATAGAGDRLRILAVIDSAFFHRLQRLQEAAGITPAAGAWMELRGLGESQTAEIVEQTALNTSTFFEAGLAQVMAKDLCQGGPCLPADLQIVAATVIDQRLTTLRRYERAGGSAQLRYSFLQRALAEAGEPIAMPILLACAAGEQVSLREFAAQRGLTPDVVEKCVTVLARRGVLREMSRPNGDRILLAHTCLVSRIREHAAMVTAQVQQARRILRRRILTGTLLSPLEIRKVKRQMAGHLTGEESATLRRSIRHTLLGTSLAALAVLAIFLGLVFEQRSSYTLALEPTKDAPSSRVVVRRGRASLSFLDFLPAQPRFGEVIADTGFAATSVARPLIERIAAGRASGTLDKNRSTPIPVWLRTVLDELGPIPRAISLVLLGDPAGIVSLKQAFVDPTMRRDALEVLAVIGSGGAGEDEILAAALNDQSPDVRRRGVEVAAAIDRRQGKGMHASILRSALADQSFAVRSAALHESETLDAATTAGVLAIALADKDPALRQVAEKGVLALAHRSTAAATDAVRRGLASSDAQARRTALHLLDQVAASMPQAAVSALAQIAADESAPEEARIIALSFLRKNGDTQAALRPALEKAVAPDAPPRLRAAALPVYARLIDQGEVEELAAAAGKGPPSSRVTAAALWGVIAIRQPDTASKPLKALVYDQSPEVRAEAARAYGYLRKDGAELIRKATTDPNADVARAAIESAVRLASQQAAVTDDLGHALLKVRPATRRLIVEALGQIAQTRPAAALPPLAKALKQGETATRAAAARAICGIAKRAPAAAAPYLRIASRDADREVRTEAAACLGSLTEGDPRAAARMAVELAASDETGVRAVVAASLGALAAQAGDIVLGPLVTLLDDADRSVRMAAATALVGCSKAKVPLAAHAGALEKRLSALFGQGDLEERQLALRTAAGLGVPAILRQAAHDSDESMRLEAIRAAAAMDPIMVDILQAGTDDRDAFVRSEAVRALSTTSIAGGAKVLPVFEAMLRSGDPATRRAGAVALGELGDSAATTTTLLAAVLRQRGESVRAAAAEAAARIAQRDPKAATPLLESALTDPAHDVRSAAIRGLGAVWAAARPPAEIAHILLTSEADSVRRLLALEGLVDQASQPGGAKAKGERGTRAKEAKALLETIAASGPPLARLAAQVGRLFLDRKLEDMHSFLEKLYGG